MGGYAERPKKPASGANDSQPNAQPRPKMSPQPGPIKFDRSSLDLAGVVGRATLGNEVTIHHDDARDLVFDAKIQGSSFSIDGRSSGVLPSEAKNEVPAPIAVRFAPTTAGSHQAQLAVTARPGFTNGLADSTQAIEGEQVVELHGVATDLGPGHDHPKGDGPAPVMELPEVASHDRHAGKMDAIDALSGLARTFDTVVVPGDQAVETFKTSIRAADAELNKRILELVRDEGDDQTARSNSTEHVGGLKAFVIKTGEVAAEELAHVGAIPVALTGLAVEWAFEIKGIGDKRREGQQRIAEYSEHMTGVMEHASPGIVGATSAMMSHYGSLVEGYAASRAKLAAIATKDTDDDLRYLHDGARSAYDVARRTIQNFEHELDAWSHQVKRIAVAAAEAGSIADTCYRVLLDRYLAFRATGGELDGRAAEKRHMTVVGHFDLGDGGMDRPMNIQLEGFQFGDYKEVSPTMRGFLESKRLDELDTWDVRIRLEGVQQDGSTSIVRVAGGRPLFAWNIGQVGYEASIMGAEKLWALLAGGSLGTHLIWVRS